MKKKEIKFYKSLDFMPIYNFLQCQKGDLCFMYKTEDYEETPRLTSELLIAWEKLEEEWNSKIGGSESKEMRMKYLRIIKLRKDVAILESCIVLLAVQQDEEIIALIRSMRYNYNEENILISLKQLQGEVKNLKNKIEEIKAELKKDTSNEYNENTMFSNIEKHRGMSINPHKVSTSLFIEYIKDFKRWQTEK